MAFGESAGILFRIKGDASDAVRAFRETEVASGGLTGSLAGLANPAALAATAVAAIGTAAVGAGLALFNLTKNAADFGSEIFDASQKTGLGAETLSALKFAAEQAGSSFEQVTKGVTNFGVEVGKAADGNDKAAAKMKLLGVTSTDLDTALKQAFKTIISGKTDTDKLALASEAFGKKIGPDLIPLIKDANGNLDELVANAKRLGVTINDDAARSADAFGDQLDLLTQQLAGVGRTIGTELMPVFTDMARDISGWLSRNKGEVKAWGEFFAKIIKEVSKTVQLLLIDIEALDDFTKNGIVDRNPDKGGYAGRGEDRQRRREALFAEQYGPFESDITPTPGNRSGTFAGGGASSAAEKIRKQNIGRADSQKDADRTADRALAADIQIEINNLAKQRDALVEAITKLQNAFKASGDFEAFAKGVADQFAKSKSDMAATLKFIEEGERRQLGPATESEKALLAQKQQDRRNELVKLGIDLQEKNKGVVEDTAKATEKELDDLDAKIEKLEKIGVLIRDEGKKTPEQIARDEERAAREAAQDKLNRTVGSGFEIGAIGQLQDLFSSEGNSAALAGLETLTSAFSQLGEAVGQVVQAWVLYGSAGTSVRKVTAQILASIAQQAAIKAIFELAEGFAALALAFFGVPNAGPSATAHFTAAAIYGGIAGVAAVAGRAVAGDSFKQQTASATGSAGSPAGGSRNIDGQGRNYSSREDQTLTGSRNAPIHITLGLRGDGVLDILETSVKNNGRGRDIIVGVV